MKNKYTTQIRLDPIDGEKMKRIADEEVRSFNNLLTAIIKDYISKYEKEHGTISLD